MMHTFMPGPVNKVYPRVIATIMAMGDHVGIDRPEAIDSHTSELHPAVITINDPSKPLVTSYGRPVNVAFALAEVLWILAGRSDVEMLESYNSTISQFSDDGTRFNAAYGERIRKSFGVDQLDDVVRTLRDDRSSRQATMVISNPVDDKGWDRFPIDAEHWRYDKHQTKDRACNLISHLMVRNGKLDWMQILRSNDAIWGMPYNFMQWMHLQQWVAGYIGVPVGNYHHIADSLHIYDKHADEAHSIAPFDLYESYSHPEMKVGNNVLNTLMREELIMRTHKAWEPPPAVYETLGYYWMQVLHVLAAHHAYTAGDDLAAAGYLMDAGPILGAAQARFYYHWRWNHPLCAPVVSDLANRMPEHVFEWATHA